MKGVCNMARAGKTGDTYYNARRRFVRSAQRNLKKAEQSSGITADKYRTIAANDLQKALDTYEQGTTQNFSKPIQKLASVLDVNLGQARQRLKDMKANTATRLRNLAEKQSTERLAGNLDDAETLRQAEAKAVFSSDVGSRIIGGLVDIWKDKASHVVTRYDKDGKPYKKTEVDKKKMFDAIFDYLGVDNLADALQKMEQAIGDRLYGDGETDTIYETVKLVIQSKVADNTLVA